MVMAMVPKVDVIVENFAPGVIKRLGFAYEDVKKINPSVIMCSISMAGQSGQLSNKAGYDYIGQAYAGVTDGIGEIGQAPVITTMAIGDISTGVAAAMAVGFALLHRERTGEGQYLDRCSTPTSICTKQPCRWFRCAATSIAPRAVVRSIRVAVLLASIAIAMTNTFSSPFLPHQWPQFVKALGMPELATDPRLRGARGRRDNNAALQKIFENWLAKFPTRDDALAALDKERVPCAPVLSVNEAINHPHLNERKTVRWVEDPLLGKLRFPVYLSSFPGWPDRIDVRSARLGEDHERLLHELLNLSDDRIKKLYSDGVLVRDRTLGPNPA